MRPLIVLYYHKIPYPFNSGTNRRIYAMVRFLRNKYRIGLVVPSYQPEIDHLKNYFDFVWYSGDYRTLAGRIKWRIQRIGYHHFFHWKFDPAFRDLKQNPLLRSALHGAWRLYQICRQYKPSLIMVQKVPNSVPIVQISRFFKIPIVLDTHDLLSIRQMDKSDTGIMPNEDVVLANELELFRLYDALIAIQYQEADLLKKLLPGQRILTALHPVEVEQSQVTELLSANEIRILFVGSASDHNIDAVNYFITNQFIQVIQAKPTVRLQICGAVSEVVKNRQHSISVANNIDWVGIVDDLQPYYQSATIVVNPVRFGSGLKIKTVEALGYGKCVVTTPIGAEGLHDAENVLVIGPPDSLGQLIVGLIQTPQKIADYQVCAREYTHKFLTPEACFQELVSWIDQAIK